MDFGTLNSDTNGTIMYTLGLVQEEGIRFLGNGGVRIVPQLWMSYFDSELDTVRALGSIDCSRLLAGLS